MSNPSHPSVASSMTPARHRWRPVILTAALVFALLNGPGHPVRAQDARSEILVLGAASLTEALTRLAAGWEAAGGAPVRFSFDATSRLAPQAAGGAAADVFFSADEHWIRWLEGRGLVRAGTRRLVAGNELVAIVPRGAPHPSGPRDLAAFRRLALANENVPAGRYAREALTSAGVWESLEPSVVPGGSVRGVLEWVARGEIPAGVVYRTDAMIEDGVEIAFTFPPASHAPVEYWAVVLSTARNPEVAGAFVDYAGGPRGRPIFASFGFSPPPITAQGSSTPDDLPGPSVASAIRLSLVVAFLATLLGLAPAVGLGWLLARREFRGKTLLSTLVLVPLVIPPVVTGFLLLSVLGSQSPLGRFLGSIGLPVPFTLLGATIAALIVGFPLYVISVRGAFEALDPLYEEISTTLGVPPRQTFVRVSLPLALPGIVAGAVLAFARALGEFGATIVLAGNVEGSTRTIALAVYTLLESPSGRDSTWLLVAASIALSLLALLGFETLSRRQKQRLESHDGR